ncbi:Zn-dependent hydrolase [Candidatus Saccharibacteria bacterium]|nr:MAG: Zn-dependent hydrolase [Candidatus Saccharibacteria bacterium]
MIDIEYLGGNAISLSTKDKKLYVDPNVKPLGLKNPKKINIQLATEERFLAPAGEDAISLEGPGEYEVEDFAIKGKAVTRHIDTEKDPEATTVYRVEAGGFNIGVIGNVSPQMSDEVYESIGVIDILIVPVGGGGYTLDAADATKVVRRTDPKIVIPVHYKDSSINYEVPQDSVDEFVKDLGVEVETADKLKLKSASNLPPVLTVYQLKRV